MLRNRRPRTKLVLLAAAILAVSNTPREACAQDAPIHPATVSSFDTQAGQALTAMRKKAAELNVSGAAIVAAFDGDTIQSWNSRMVVVGTMKHPQTATEKGDNLLAVAYAKAAEMADTLQNSGSQVRPPMTGEFGWKGGVIVKTKTGYMIAAFSGGTGEQDVLISQAGLVTLQLYPAPAAAK